MTKKAYKNIKAKESKTIKMRVNPTTKQFIKQCRCDQGQKCPKEIQNYPIVEIKK